jgi:ABC-type uncharacterized transport system permease subunit
LDACVRRHDNWKANTYMKRIPLYWRLFWKFRALQLQVMMEYRADFIFWAFVSLMWTWFNFFFFQIIIGVNHSLAGWSLDQMYLLLGVFTMFDSFTWSFFAYNMRRYTNFIFEGSLSQFLVKPIDTQFMMTLQWNTYNNIFRFLAGIWIVVQSCQKLGISFNFFNILLFIFLFCVGLFFIYSLWFMISTGAFWVEKLNSINDVVPELRRAFQVPKEVYSGLFSTLFTVILPVGLISALPSEALLSRYSWSWIIYFTCFTIFLFYLSRWFFHISLKRYQGIAN